MILSKYLTVQIIRMFFKKKLRHSIVNCIIKNLYLYRNTIETENLLCIYKIKAENSVKRQRICICIKCLLTDFQNNIIIQLTFLF